MTTDELLGKEKCNPEYYGYGALEDPHFSVEDIFMDGDVLNTLAYQRR